MYTPIIGSDFNISVYLTNDGSVITTDVDFELVCYDSYNQGKVYKYTPTATFSDYLWTVKFPASAQKFVGPYHLRCNVSDGQIVFRNAFVMDSPDVRSIPYVFPSTEVVVSDSKYAGFIYGDGTFSVSCTATNGTVTGMGVVKSADRCTLTFAPATGFTSAEWTGLPSGATISGYKATFIVTSDITATVIGK